MSPLAPTTDDAGLRRRWFGVRWPVFFQAPADPLVSAPVAYDEVTTATRFTWRVILGARKYTIPAGLLLVVSQIGQALVPVIMGLAIDRALATTNTGELVLWLTVLAADFVVFSVAFRFGSRMGLFGMQTVQHRLRTQVTDRILHPAGMASRQLDGAALSIATSDVFRLAAAMQLGIYPVGSLAAVIFCAAVLLVISWPLGITVLLGAPLMLWLMNAAGNPLRKRSQAQQALTAAAVGQAADLMAGYRVIKGIHAETVATTRYETVSQEALVGALRAKTSFGLYTGAMNLVTGMFIAALAMLAGFLALEGHLSVGELITVVGLTQFLIGPLTTFASTVGAVWATGHASGARVLDLLRTPHATNTATTAIGETSPRRGSADVPDLDITLHDGRKITVAAGECVGVRADAVTGHGLLRSLSRANDVGDRVLLDDTRAADLDLDHYRATVLVSPHASELFDGTVGENLTVPGADPDRVPEALSAAACEDIVDALEAGLDTQVGEGGTRLSGGQRQRLALARAYATDAPVLVLHDPTTAIDSVTEAVIANRLPGIRQGRSTVIITSSPTLLGACNRVIEIDPQPVAS